MEIKILQRDKECDLNVMLLDMLYTLKYEDDLDVIYSQDFERDFIPKCFFCGCIPGLSGLAISYFVIKNTSFHALVKKLEKTFQQRESKRPDRNRIRGIIIGILKTLIDGLKYDKDGTPFEQILICNGSGHIMAGFNKFSKEEDIIDFANSLFGLESWIVRVMNSYDDLPKLYEGIKKSKFCTDGNLQIFYTVYRNSVSEVKGYPFIFCKLSDRKKPGCITRSFVKKTFSGRTSEIKELLDFVGLPVNNN